MKKKGGKKKRMETSLPAVMILWFRRRNALNTAEWGLSVHVETVRPIYHSTEFTDKRTKETDEYRKRNSL